MSAVYFLAQIRITDSNLYQKYLDKCDDIFSRCNGKYLAVDSAPEILEGNWKYSKSVLIEFPNREDFKEWYYSDDYQEILKYRLSGAACDTILVFGKEQKPGNKILIRTERLTIKPITLADASAMFEYRTKEKIFLFQTFKPGTLHEIEDFIRNSTTGFNEEGRWFQLGIFHNSTMIGDIGIHFIGPENSQCEIGYTIHPVYQKKGYGKESVIGVVNYLFKVLQKHRITASTDPQNAASIALLESLGFRKEGLFKKSLFINGNWEDDLIYAILAEEWEYQVN